MRRGLHSRPVALAIASIALFVALGGSVYAGQKIHGKKINGKRIRAKSLPGNRLALESVPANRLKPGSISSAQLAPGAFSASQLAPGSVTGIQVDVATLGEVPSAVHADNAESARDAQTALNAVSALDAQRVNGHSAGCQPDTRFFAGACWQTGSSEAAVPAPTAALSCANIGGELPNALQLAAFSQLNGIALAAGGEWSGDLTNFSGGDLYAAVAVSPSGSIGTAGSTATKKYRCVIPLVT